MNNFDTVFKTVKEHCGEVGVLHETCYDHIVKALQTNNTLLSIDTYLEILQDLGLIKFCKYTNGILITEKGMATDKLFRV
ncbi:MAG: hypothetical protein JWQ38_888 [Flavipsychrobacter sp.]|nr:hypothetical protein [Flavipsychrobacter sp.]